ncbi:MAG: sigma-54-dependent Fis family transcriptional regulator [Gammaproteobacteria bacterium]|nr:sigma-54-dependent Fis family transcriptional regulator [Gammaproteobacteria bacterium]
MTPTALIVDDEPDLCELLSLTLRRMDVRTETAHDLASAREKLETGSFDLCLTDMRLPDGDGLDLVTWIARERPALPVAMITAHGHVEAAVQALKLGAFDFVAKPIDLERLRKMLHTALQLNAERNGRARATDSDGARTPGDAGTRLIGASPAMQRLREMIARVARSQAPVHICGESGTGKELVARMIHEASPRRDGAFVPINCGAVPAELMESEFFGHRKGSFTGAVADKPGLFQSAEGGTLFLDEVAELPLHMQVKLLRVIQEKAVRPVGENREVPVDVRILSATHCQLAELVAAGRFREDLFYRINVIELRVPPLRERGEDVLLLARHVLARLAAEMGLEQPPALSAAAEARLRAHPFPGNVRELENTLERAITLVAGETIEAGDIQLLAGAGEATGAEGETGGAMRLGSALEEVERQAIREALEQTRYNKTAAAKRLGMTFRQLRYRIKKLGIE